MAAPSMNWKAVMLYIEEAMPATSPTCFGLHPNAEIGFRMAQSLDLFKNILELQPRSSISGGGAMTVQEKAHTASEEIVERLSEIRFEWREICDRVEDRNPYTNVFLQEIERMIALIHVLRSSLHELELGLRGDLTMTAGMEAVMNCLCVDKVPTVWEKCAYPSLRPLGLWVRNLLDRCKQLMDWVGDMQLPKCTWISGFFNPQSFLTAVMQSTARRMDWPLDKTMIQTDVTKKQPDDVALASRDGVFVFGLELEGARWDDKAGNGSLEVSRSRELYNTLPVILVKAVPQEKLEHRDAYCCPVYKTTQRGPTYVFSAYLRTKVPPETWVLAGVAMIMDIGTGSPFGT
jgi:dynein heavy chain